MAEKENKNQPDCDGHFWWREGPGKNWELAKVQINPFKARFFNGSQITSAWGEWRKAEIQKPAD